MKDQLVRVIIPTTNEFLNQWHLWIQGKVAKHFKRDKERIPDIAQRARLRLLSKDFVSRWFFKHLTDDLIDTDQAIAMLGGVKIQYIGSISPREGSRISPDAMWCIKDILNFAKFDYERYFYSIQDHTLDTDKFVRYLGLGSLDSSGRWVPDTNSYATLQSLYRQGRVRPSEFTEHYCKEKNSAIPHEVGFCGVQGCNKKHFSKGYCSGHYASRRKSSCPECDSGRDDLLSKGISLASDWSNPGVSKAVSKLRWNDRQLEPFLRDWNNSNRIKSLPRYILRKPSEATVDAGLLKYANMIIDNDVVNAFKSLGRTDDKPKSDTDTSDDEGVVVQLHNGHSESGEDVVDDGSDQGMSDVEDREGVKNIMVKSGLSDLEMKVVYLIDIDGWTSKDLAENMSLTVARINGIRSSALAKMRSLVKEEHFAKYA